MLARDLQKHLEAHDVRYVTIGHETTYTAERTAESAHVSGHEVAKVVMVEADGELAMAVVRATDRVDLDLLRGLAGARSVRLASEADFAARFPGVEPGAMPPFGHLYGMPVYVDEALAKDEEIVFNAGNHHELVRLAYAEFARMERPREGSFTA